MVSDRPTSKNSASGRRMELDSLGHDADGAAAKPAMADAAHAVLADHDPPAPGAAGAGVAAEHERGLRGDALRLAQTGLDTALVDKGVGRADAGPEIRLEFFDGQRRGNDVQRR